MKELNKQEMINLCGGDKFLSDLGEAIGYGFRKLQRHMLALGETLSKSKGVYGCKL